MPSPPGSPRRERERVGAERRSELDELGGAAADLGDLADHPHKLRADIVADDRLGTRGLAVKDPLDDVGVPRVIGSVEGGHERVAPLLLGLVGGEIGVDPLGGIAVERPELGSRGRPASLVIGVGGVGQPIVERPLRLLRPGCRVGRLRVGRRRRLLLGDPAGDLRLEAVEFAVQRGEPPQVLGTEPGERAAGLGELRLLGRELIGQLLEETLLLDEVLGLGRQARLRRHLRLTVRSFRT